MACRQINTKYADEGYIIKEVNLEELCKSEKVIPQFPNDGNPEVLQKLFEEFNVSRITQQAIIQQYNELYVFGEATPEEREILAPQVKVVHSLFNIPDIYYPKFYPLLNEEEVWSLSEKDLGIRMGQRLQWFGISFNQYKNFVEKVSYLCEEFDLREDDILLNPSNLGYHPVLGLRIIDYGLTNSNQLLDFLNNL